MLNAIRSGDLDQIRELAKHSDINKANHSFPLLQATYYEKEEVVKLLIELGADVNQRVFQFRQSALDIAVSKQNYTIVKYLLEVGAKLGVHVTPFGTPIQNACRQGNLQIVILLMAYGASIECGEFDSPIVQAIRWKHMSIINVLLYLGVNLNANPNFCFSPLIQAVVDRNLEMCQLLVNAGADVNWPSSPNNWTALHYSAGRNCDQIAKYLLSQGAVQTKTVHNVLPFNLACIWENTKVIDLLAPISPLGHRFCWHDPVGEILLPHWISRRFFLVWVLGQQVIGCTRVFPSALIKEIVQMV